MIEELQIRVTPRTASCEEAIAHYIASERHMSMKRIQGVRIINGSSYQGRAERPYAGFVWT